MTDAMFTPHDVKLIWRTDDAEQMIVRMARVSAPRNAGNMSTGPKLLRYLIRHMARGLLHAHKNGIVMNDVSLENTMLHFVNDNISPLVFLMDWGMAKYILANDYGERICDCNIGKFYGKLAYMAPEVWTGSRAAGPTCDGIPAESLIYEIDK